MKMENTKRSFYLFLAVFLAALWISCNTSKSYKAKYKAAWKQLVQSDKWNTALVEESETDLISEDGDSADLWVTGNVPATLKTEDPFDHKYRLWIERAYYKIIDEAEAADAEIKAEYNRFIAENPEANSSSDQNVIGILALYKKKYHAHNVMLEGLKSWNSFEEFGSDDLEFFTEEHKDFVYRMNRNGIQENKIVNFLVYKLADLYHLDVQEMEY